MITFLGLKQYNKNKHKHKKSKIDAVRKSVRGEMRLLGQIYHVATYLDGFATINQNLTDLFARENFFNLAEALEQLTERKDGKNESLNKAQSTLLASKVIQEVAGSFCQN